MNRIALFSRRYYAPTQTPDPTMTTIILGNGNNLSVFDDNSIRDTIILGNGKLSSTFTASPAPLPRVMTPSPSL